VVRGPPAAARPLAFVAASGSAGTLGAGDWLKERHGTRIVAVEALECPTMLENGFGEHNIQGIGDKHIPLIHNVMNTDYVVAVPNARPTRCNLLFNTAAGREPRAPPGVPAAIVSARARAFEHLQRVAAIKTRRYYDLGPDDVI
jgi:cysteine synthase